MLQIQNDRLFMLHVLASIIFLCHQRLRSHRSKGVFSCFQLTYTYGVFRHGNPILESNSPYSNESFLLIYPIQDMRFEVDGFTSQGCPLQLAQTSVQCGFWTKLDKTSVNTVYFLVPLLNTLVLSQCDFRLNTVFRFFVPKNALTEALLQIQYSRRKKI